MSKVYDAVCVTGKYTDREGNEKRRYVTVGAVFVNDKGQYSMRLESIPVQFDGWINFYPPKEQQKPDRKAAAPQTDDIPYDDQIPF